MENVNAIRSAHWFWLLIPNAETPSQGAYFEFGLAWGNKPCIASGGDQRFVFSSLAGELFETDDQAFEAISAISSAGP
jgi:hypothetical protein